MKRRYQIAYNKLKESAEKSKELSKNYYDRNTKDKIFKKGNLVLLLDTQVKRGRSRKLQLPWIGHYEIIKINGKCYNKKGKI